MSDVQIYALKFNEISLNAILEKLQTYYPDSSIGTVKHIVNGQIHSVNVAGIGRVAYVYDGVPRLYLLYIQKVEDMVEITNMFSKIHYIGTGDITDPDSIEKLDGLSREVEKEMEAKKK